MMLHLILPDHFSKTEAQFSSAHRTRQRNHHLATFIQVSHITFGCINQSCSIEMPVMMDNEISDWFLTHSI